MNDYALVKDGKVINTIYWGGPGENGETDMDFGEGVTALLIPEGESVGIGYSYDGSAFNAPPPTQAEIDAALQAATVANQQQKEALMNEASQRISILQDAVDLEIATEEEANALPLWKKYRVLLSRVDANKSDNVSWPEKPV